MIETDSAKWCQCDACKALRLECGSHYGWLSRKLLVKGWAGRRSPAEKAYQRAHRPPPSRAQMENRAKWVSTARKPRDRSRIEEKR